MQLKFTKPRERRRQLKPPLGTHSKLANLGAHLPRGAHPRSPGKAALLPPPLPPSSRPQSRSPAASSLGRTGLLAKLRDKPRKKLAFEALSVGGSGTCRPQQ